MASFFKKLKGVFRVFNAIKGFVNSIKSAVSLLGLPFAGWALIVVAIIAIYMVATSYEELRSSVVHMRQDFVSQNTLVGTQPEIQTSVTKDDPDWMRKYCDEQVAKLPPAPFKYKEKTVEGIGISLPSLEIGRRMPKNDKGYNVKSITCRIIYDFDEKEAFSSMGVEYNFDIKAFNEFYKRVDEIYTLSIDPTWEKIVLNEGEGGNPHYSYQGFPLIFMRENLNLGTVEYARMNFAIDFWVSFTVYEKLK